MELTVDTKRSPGLVPELAKEFALGIHRVVTKPVVDPATRHESESATENV